MKGITMLLMLLTMFLGTTISSAEQIGSIETSGLMFKDKLVVQAFDDPDIKGITCYIALPKKSLSFSDQTDASISCRQTGAVGKNLSSRKRIFKEKKGIFVKSLFMDRIWDKQRNVLVYVSYTSKLSGDNASNSISVVSLGVK